MIARAGAITFTSSSAKPAAAEGSQGSRAVERRRGVPPHDRDGQRRRSDQSHPHARERRELHARRRLRRAAALLARRRETAAHRDLRARRPELRGRVGRAHSDARAVLQGQRRLPGVPHVAHRADGDALRHSRRRAEEGAAARRRLRRPVRARQGNCGRSARSHRRSARAARREADLEPDEAERGSRRGGDVAAARCWPKRSRS